MAGSVEARTATFLMSDIEGSTRLWQDEPAAMAVALEAHDNVLRIAIGDAGGTVVKMTGDGVLAVFDRAEAALKAAVDAQRRLVDRDWPTAAPLGVRMSIHAGTAEARDGDYFGPTLNRLARLLAIGHGGQVLLSAAGAALVRDALPDDVELLDRGEHRLRDLNRPEHVFQLAAPGLPGDFPALRSGPAQTNLPVQLTSFIGREREVVDVRQLVAARRMVTLVGVGGTGKTRLMLEVAGPLVERHEHGVWLVELAPITDPDLVVQELARALGVPDSPGQPVIAAVTDYLRDKSLLLLLDNCEHIIQAAADLTVRLLESCRSLRVLATSREALGIAGEAIVQVPSLELPPVPAETIEGGAPEASDAEAVAATEAVRLFIDRARAVAPDLPINAATLASIAEVCRRLDGIPLAIELAAARVNVLSVAEISQRVGDRFRLLTGGRRTSVPRQQTLQALIDWSWDLLAEPDQRLLRRLSVFAGGWTLEAAAEVTADLGADAVVAADDVLDGLARLADRSLVVVNRGESTRYGMLETIRQYARDRLMTSGEGPETRTRHLNWYRRLATTAAGHLEGPHILVWLDRLDVELENLRAALDWAFGTDLPAALEMTVDLAQYWRHRSVGTEGSDRLSQAVEALGALPDAAPGEPADVPVAILMSRVKSAAAAAAATTTRNFERAHAWADDATRLAQETGDPAALRSALTASALVGVFGGAEAFADIDARSRETLRVAEEAQAWQSVAFLAAALAMHDAPRDRGAAEALLQQATDAAARSGNVDSIAFAAMGRARVLSFYRDLDAARPWFETALNGFRLLNDRRLELAVRSDFAHALRRGGRVAEAESEYRHTILEWQRLGNRGAVANQLEGFAFVSFGRDDAVRAAVLLGAAEHLREISGAGMLAYERAEYDAEMGRLRAALDDATFERAWTEGRALSIDQAIALARSERNVTGEG